MELPTNANMPAGDEPIDRSADIRAQLEEEAAKKARLDELTKDFQRLKLQKTRKSGGVEGRVLVNLCFVGGEQGVTYENQTISARPTETGKLNLVFNLIGPRLGKLIGRISAMGGTYKARPDVQTPKALAEAAVVDRMLVALDEKLDQPSVTWQILWWMAVGGVAFVHTCWVPNATIDLAPAVDESGEQIYTNTITGEELPESVMRMMTADPMMGVPPELFELKEEPQLEGDVGCEVFGPLNVFIDQSVRGIDDLGPDQRLYIAKIRTLGWIRENYNVEVEADKSFSIVSSHFNQHGDALGGIFLKDLIPLVQGSSDDGDPDLAVVVDAFGPVSVTNPEGTYDVFLPGKQLLQTGPSPYGEIPVVDFHWKPVTTSFWTADYVSDLIPGQKFLNKRLSQLGEQSNSTLYASLLLGGGLKPADIPTDYPGAVENGLDEDGNPRVRRLEPPQLPTWFMQSMDMVVKIFNDIAGGADLFQESRFPGQLRGPMAVPMLQEILDTEWGPLYMHIGQRMSRVKQQRLNRVKQYYPESRTLHYTDRTMKDEVVQFHADKLLRGGTNYNVTVDRGSLIPELRALREARVIERLTGPLAIMYMDERTGRLDKSKIAADIAFGDAGRESREASYRKLGLEIVELLWKAQPVPPVFPFYDHGVMMDELEGAMSTMEFLRASPQVQKAFSSRWEEHRAHLIQEAQAQQAAMQNAAVAGAVAQATQQAAATSAVRATDAAFGEAEKAKAQPTEAIVRRAEAERPAQRRPAPANLRRES